MSEQRADESDMRELPRVIISQRVIDNIVRGALLYPEPETGETMIGLVVPRTGWSEPDIYVLDTISPGERVVREWGMFEQGDDWQADVFNWLYNNWETFRELRRGSYGNAIAAKWDVPLMHVGDWHKQPDDMIAPSGGDADTARHMITDAETPLQHLVAPIVTMYPLHPPAPPVAVESVPEVENSPAAEPSPVEESATAVETEPDTQTPVLPAEPVDETEKSVMSTPGDKLAIKVPVEDQGWLVQINFWYMSKHSRRFTAIVPEIWPAERLPNLPPIAWHLLHPKRFDQEFTLLTEAGYKVDIIQWDADGKPPYEICFSVYKPGTRYVILLVTSVDYPATMPAIRTAPLVTLNEGEDLFEKLYAVSQAAPLTQMPDWSWDSKRTLVELVWHIEKLLKEDVAS